MEIIHSELNVDVDIDETLISHTIGEVTPGQLILSIDYYGTPKKVITLNDNIDLLKSFHKRGYKVTVQSANGYEWALNVIKSLGLDFYVDFIRTKPYIYIDDKSADEWMRRLHIL